MNTPLPPPLDALLGYLRRPGVLVRTAVVVAPAATCAVGASEWAAQLDLTPHHLGRAVLARVRAQQPRTTYVRLDVDRLLADVLAALPPDNLPVPAATELGGAWVWGAESLLPKLPTAERTRFWERLRGQVPHRPPLVVVLPEAFRRFGPPDLPDWGARGLVLPPEQVVPTGAPAAAYLG